MAAVITFDTFLSRDDVAFRFAEVEQPMLIVKAFLPHTVALFQVFLDTMQNVATDRAYTFQAEVFPSPSGYAGVMRVLYATMCEAGDHSTVFPTPRIHLVGRVSLSCESLIAFEKYVVVLTETNFGLCRYKIDITDLPLTHVTCLKNEETVQISGSLEEVVRIDQHRYFVVMPDIFDFPERRDLSPFIRGIHTYPALSTTSSDFEEESSTSESCSRGGQGGQERAGSMGVAIQDLNHTPETLPPTAPAMVTPLRDEDLASISDGDRSESPWAVTEIQPSLWSRSSVGWLDAGLSVHESDTE